MTKISIPFVQLYSHSPQSLIPLLNSHLPGSLRVYGTITSNPNFSNDAYTTFPPDTTRIPEIWVIILPLPEPVNDQIRIYCSLDESMTSTSTSGNQGRQLSPDLLKEGTEMVIGALNSYRDRLVGVNIKVGGIGTLWTEALREVWGISKRPTYWYWLAPDGDGVDQVVSESDLKKREGLMVDIGRDIDIDIIQSTCDIQRSREYYQARLRYTTTIRPKYDSNKPDSEIPQAVCWIVTHNDGSQGALYTLPEYRRRGLAKWVTEERLRAVKKDDRDARGFVCVAQGNEGSEALWLAMGWVRGWSVEWVY